MYVNNFDEWPECNSDEKKHMIEDTPLRELSVLHKLNHPTGM